MAAIWAAAVPAAGQNSGALFNKAPAGVEEALRDRVTKFYGLQMEGKFRQSEALVCEASKDAYYDADKKRWKDLEIIRVNFSDEFKAASVLSSLGYEMQFPSGESIPAKVPVTSRWKLEEGTWCFHIPPPSNEPIPSPFGPRYPQPNTKGSGPTAGLTKTLPSIPSAEQIINSVRISKKELRLKSYAESADELEISNGLGGQVQLDLRAPEMDGLSLTLSAKVVDQGGKATLRAAYKPVAKSYKPPASFEIMVEPLNRAIPVTIIFDISDEEKKQLPTGIVK